MNIVMIPTYVTPDKHNIKAIPRAFLFITLTKATYTVLRMEKSMPDLLLLCYDWFCLEGEKSKKNSYFTDVVIHTGDQCLI